MDLAIIISVTELSENIRHGFFLPNGPPTPDAPQRCLCQISL